MVFLHALNLNAPFVTVFYLSFDEFLQNLKQLSLFSLFFYGVDLET